MPQKWLADLWLSKPALAEALQGLCCVSVSKLTDQTHAYVVRVVDGKKVDKITLALFWKCIGLRKIDHEDRQKKKS